MVRENSMKACVLATILLTILSLTVCGCDGGGDGQPRGEATTIRGRVADIVTAMNQIEERPSVLSNIKDFLSISKRATAQTFDNIVVTCIADGAVAETTTNADGEFVCVVPDSPDGNSMTVNFRVDGEELSIVLLNPQGINAVIVVVILDLQGNEVVVEEMVFSGTLSCDDNETKNIAIEGGDTELMIMGEGEDCIRTTGNCSVIIEHDNVTLNNCERCIDARGESRVSIVADNLDDDGVITCDADAECIRARGNASVDINAFNTFGGISFDSNGENCIRAQGTSAIELNFFDDNCTVIGDIRIDGNPDVNGTENCDVILP
jgi:hypothetical protein